jgi:hypothetical protein
MSNIAEQSWHFSAGSTLPAKTTTQSWSLPENAEEGEAGQTGKASIWAFDEESLGAGWVAASEVRVAERPSSSSQDPAEPTGSRCTREPRDPVCLLPHGGAWPAELAGEGIEASRKVSDDKQHRSKASRRFDPVAPDTYRACVPGLAVDRSGDSRGLDCFQEVLKTFVFHVVIEEDPLEDGRMAYAAYVPKWKSLGAASIPHGSLRAMPWTPESRLRHCVIPVLL